MADPISTASGLLTLVVFAFQSSQLLYKAVASFESNRGVIRELREELEALDEVLRSLRETAVKTDEGLTALKLPLLCCGKACNDFEAVIIKCTAHSGEPRTIFKEWAKLEYMGDDIVGFKNMLAGYKSTIIIALADANIRKSAVTTSIPKDYKELTKNTVIDLEYYLQEIYLQEVDKKLQSIYLKSGNNRYNSEQCKLSCEARQDLSPSGNMNVPSTSGSILTSNLPSTLRSVENHLGRPAEVEFTHTKYGSYETVPFTTVKQLGHGSLGSVDAVRRNGDDLGTLMARKVINLPNAVRGRLLPLIQQEVAVLRGLKHKHIVQILSTYEITSVPRQFGMLLSPAGDEDLSYYLERVGENAFPKEDLNRLKSWPSCLASAVAYIHSQSIRHKEIKPSNIICRGDEILLTDFGSAHQFSTSLTSSTEGYAVGVTKMYCAPEVIAFDRRGRSADIYSLGCVFAEMFTVAGGRRIEDFHDFRSEPVLDEPGRMTHVYHATAHKLEAWFVTQDEVWPFSLVSRMMADDPQARLTAGDLKILVRNSTSCECNCSALA